MGAQARYFAEIRSFDFQATMNVERLYDVRKLLEAKGARLSPEAGLLVDNKVQIQKYRFRSKGGLHRTDYNFTDADGGTIAQGSDIFDGERYIQFDASQRIAIATDSRKPDVSPYGYPPALLEPFRFSWLTSGTFPRYEELAKTQFWERFISNANFVGEEYVDQIPTVVFQFDVGRAALNGKSTAFVVYFAPDFSYFPVQTEMLIDRHLGNRYKVSGAFEVSSTSGNKIVAFSKSVLEEWDLMGNLARKCETDIIPSSLSLNSDIPDSEFALGPIEALIYRNLSSDSMGYNVSPDNKTSFDRLDTLMAETTKPPTSSRLASVPESATKATIPSSTSIRRPLGVLLLCVFALTALGGAYIVNYRRSP